jgi:hypothetical protein
VCLLSVCASAEQIPGSEFSYQNWQGQAWTFAGTSTFSHCAISTPYVTGDILILSVNADGTVGLGVQSSGLRLTAGETFPVTLTVDSRPPIYATATAAASDFAGLHIPNFDEAMTALKKGRLLRIDSAVGQASYDLTGTFHALDAAKECAFRNMSYNAAPPPSLAPTSVDKTVLFQIATQMISDLHVTDFNYMTEQEGLAAFETDGVFWTSSSNGLVGGIASVPKGSLLTLSETDGSDVAFLSKRCGGDLATTFRSIPATDVLIREIRAVCIKSGVVTESHMTKALIGDTVVYTMLIFNGAAEQSSPISRDELSANVAIKSASFIIDNQRKN